MSGGRLREAARVLRETAGEEPHPWPCRSYIKNAIRHVERNCEVECSHATWNDTTLEWDDPGCPGPDGYWDRYTTGDYIATMHPGVGLALADLLDYVSRYTSDPLDEGVTEALAVADAILGGQS